ncbi:NTP transferase domain-containing protein [Rhizobium mongolense]|uniref:nucleotidyltransferase family protein n=1 Tax=Rhizobium mongolense TaxID=57676 RepID=UPI0035573612
MSDDHQHKLLSEFDGVSLVRRSASVASASQASTVFAVTGHRRFEIEAALEGVGIAVVFNPFFGSGIASSIIAGWQAAHAGGADGCFIMLADMPLISTADSQVNRKPPI